MFAAILIAVGKDVIIDRHIHFEDRALAEGGCREKTDNEGPLVRALGRMKLSGK